MINSQSNLEIQRLLQICGYRWRIHNVENTII